MVSMNGLYSKRNKTAKFGMMNTFKAVPETNKLKDSKISCPSSPQMYTNMEGKIKSQNPAFNNQISNSTRSCHQNFANQKKFLNSPQSVKVTSDGKDFSSRLFEPTRKRFNYSQSAEPKDNTYLPIQSNVVTKNSRCAGRNCLRNVPLTPPFPVPLNNVMQPLAPSVRKPSPERNDRSQSLQFQFIDKLSPSQRRVRLYGSNLNNLTSEIMTKADEGRRQVNSDQSHYHRFHHHHHHRHQSSQFKKFMTSEGQITGKSGDGLNSHHNRPSPGLFEKASNKNVNSTTSEYEENRKLKDEDIVKVLELMVSKLMSRSSEVDRDLLNELKISLTDSPRDSSSSGKHSRNSSTSPSSASSFSTAATAATTKSSVESNGKVAVAENTRKPSTCNSKGDELQLTENKLNVHAKTQSQSGRQGRESFQTSSSRLRYKKLNEQSRPSQQQNKKPNKEQVWNNKRPRSSKKTQHKQTSAPYVVEPNLFWDTTSIRRLKVAVDDLFDNILDTLKTDHSSVASDASCERKESGLVNANNCNSNRKDNLTPDKKSLPNPIENELNTIPYCDGTSTTQDQTPGDEKSKRQSISTELEKTEGSAPHRLQPENDMNLYEQITKEVIAQNATNSKSGDDSNINYIFRNEEIEVRISQKRDNHPDNVATCRIPCWQEKTSSTNECRKQRNHQCQSFDGADNFNKKRYFEGQKNFQGFLCCQEKLNVRGKSVAQQY